MITIGSHTTAGSSICLEHGGELSRRSIDLSGFPRCGISPLSPPLPPFDDLPRFSFPSFRRGTRVEDDGTAASGRVNHGSRRIEGEVGRFRGPVIDHWFEAALKYASRQI